MEKAQDPDRFLDVLIYHRKNKCKKGRFKNIRDSGWKSTRSSGHARTVVIYLES